MADCAALHLLLLFLLLGSEATAPASSNDTRSASSTGSSSGSEFTSGRKPGSGTDSNPKLSTGLPWEPRSGSALSSGPRAANGSVTFGPCDEIYPGTYQCTAEYGNITSIDVSLFDDEVTYTFPRPTTISVMVWVSRDQLSTDVTDNGCYFTIAGQTFNPDDKHLRDVNTFYITSDEDIRVSSKGSPGCFIAMQYAAIAPEYNTTTIPADLTAGTIVFPSDPQLGGVWSYPVQQRLAYLFNYPANYAITLTITLDLGHRSPYLNSHVGYRNLTSSDFLLVGIGTEILASIDQVLYGRHNETVTVRIYNSAAHVVVYTDYHEQDASGLVIGYEAHEVTGVVMTTTESTTTIFAPTLPTPDSTWAPIDGVLNTYTSKAELDDAFCAAAASMASTYIVSTGMQVDPPQSVSPEDVQVYSTATCRKTTCQDSCAAFNFSIKKLAPSQETWAFSAADLDAMLRDDALQQVWSDDMCTDCTFCEENTHHSWWVLGGVAVGVVVVTLLLAVVVWKASSHFTQRKSKQDQEEDQKLEALERRRRSSGDVSVIGGVKGGAKASLPFGGGEMEDEDEELCDTAGFTEYDADNTIEDLSVGPEVLNDPRAMKFFYNEGFEADEPDFTDASFPLGRTVYRANPGFVEAASSARPHSGAIAPPGGTSAPPGGASAPPGGTSAPPSGASAPLSVVTAPIPVLKSSLKRRHLRDAAGGKLPAVEEAESDDGDEVTTLQLRPSNRRLLFNVAAEVHQESPGETAL